MQIDSPAYYRNHCPADNLLGSCPTLSSPEAVVDHLLADHDPRVIATLLVRETYMNGRIADVLDVLGATVEKEADALIADPLSGNTILEIQFGDEG